MQNQFKLKSSIVPVCILCFLGSCSSEKGVIRFEVHNPADVANPSALITIPYAAIVKKTNGQPAAYYHAAINKKQIQTQLDDLDGDGQWDELVCLAAFQPDEKITLELTPVASKPATIGVIQAHVRHQRLLGNGSFGPSLTTDTITAKQQPTDFSKTKLPPFLTEGPAWENDRVGFRLYFDTRNGKDIWGKLRPDMVLDRVGVDSNSNYHTLSDWGMDLLKVGASLGAGALAIYIPDLDGKDSLIRVGGSQMGSVIYEKVADGPIRALFRMRYNDWQVHPTLSPVSLTEEIQIWGGQLFYESKVSSTGLPDQAFLVTGLVNLYEAPKKEMKIDNAAVLYTHQVQSENKDRLGMAIMLNKDELQEFSTATEEATDIRNTYLVKMKTAENGVSRFRFYAVWEKSAPEFADEGQFETFLKKEVKTFQQPLRID